MSDLRVKGLRGLNRSLKQLPGNVARKVLRSAGRRSGNIVRKAWREEIDAQGLVDTGDARRAIKVSTKASRDGVDVQVHSGKAFYLMFHEFGTSKHEPRPTARPALERSRNVIIDQVGKFIGDGVEKEAKRLKR